MTAELVAYIIFIVALIYFLTKNVSGYDSWLTYKLIKHLMLTIIGGPLALLYFFNYCFNETILTPSQKRIFLAVTAMV